MNLADLTKRVLPDVPGCPDPVIEQALQKAAVRFFRDSGVWRVRWFPINLVSGQSDYAFDWLPGVRLERILRAQHGDTPLTQIPHEDVALQDEAGKPRACAINAEGDLVLYPTPDNSATEDAVSAYVMLAPKRTVTEIPDRLAEEWEDALVAFAKADLLDTPQKPWTDPKAAQYQRRLYARELAMAKSEALSGHGAARTVRPQRFGA